MRKNILITLIIVAIVVMAGCLLATEVTPNKGSFVPATTVYFDVGQFHDTHYTDTLIFTSNRNFTSAESTAVFVQSIDCTGYLKASILDDSSVVITSTVETDSTKKFFWLIITKQ